MLTPLPEGTVILHEKEVNMDMYKIIEGSVEVYIGYGTKNEALLGILSEGSYFGEIGLLAQKPAIYTVIAFTDIVLERITMTEIDNYIKTNHHDILAIMQHMADTMYNLNHSMNLVIDDVVESRKIESKEAYKAKLDKLFAKYNVWGALAAAKKAKNS